MLTVLSPLEEGKLKFALTQRANSNYGSAKQKLLDIYYKEKQLKRKTRKLIFFVVHGLEANPFDMRHIRAAILTNIPNSSVHLIQKNYNLTNECITKQGKRFADEVLDIYKYKDITGKESGI